MDPGAVFEETHAMVFFLTLYHFIDIHENAGCNSVGSIHSENGLGYTSKQWQESETIAFVKSLAKDVKIYSNGPDVLGFLTENQSLSVPKKKSPTTLRVNTNYTAEIGAMCKDIMENRAILVYFNTIKRSYQATYQEVKSACKLSVVQRLADGIVYGMK